MNFKPSNFYFGIIDFFSILLPGAIITLIIYLEDVLGIGSLVDSVVVEKEGYWFFLGFLSSYLIGHVINQMSAYLDKYVYDMLNGKLVYAKEKDRINLNEVKRIRAEKYGQQSSKYLNNFEWSKNRLLQDLPAVIDGIERYIADSKFFRSFVLIFPLLSILLWNKAQVVLGFVCLVLAGFSLARYFHKRRKATETAYKGVIFLENSPTSNEPIDREYKPRRTSQQPYDSDVNRHVEFLTKGFPGTISYIELPPKTKWPYLDSNLSHRVICCLQGKGILYLNQERHKTVLSKNACLTIPIQQDVSYENPGNESLLLVSVIINSNQ